jgi:ubiquinol-cytochrome c reductase iron-sulfur subunit
LKKTTDEDNKSRRDFIHITSGVTVATGVGAAAWPLIDQMNPSADVLAFSTIEVDLAPLQPGQSISVLWRGKPLFLRFRTEEEITKARDVDINSLKDPQIDADRVQNAKYLVMVGVCTHLGCVPLGQQGEYGGWFCPCHGSHYDTSGRIRKGPAPSNLEVPPYVYLDDTTIKIG